MKLREIVFRLAQGAVSAMHSNALIGNGGTRSVRQHFLLKCCVVDGTLIGFFFRFRRRALSNRCLPLAIRPQIIESTGNGCVQWEFWFHYIFAGDGNEHPINRYKSCQKNFNHFLFVAFCGCRCELFLNLLEHVSPNKNRSQLTAASD